jgi:putative inorganic carbon (hco3(-)) transporter
MSGSVDPMRNQYERGRLLVVLGPVSLAIVGVAVLVSNRLMVGIVFIGTVVLIASIVIGVRHFEFLTLLMIGGRTAIDLAHPGVDEEALRLSVLVTGLYTLISVVWLIVRRLERPLRISPIGKAVAVVTMTAILSGVLSDERVAALIGASRWVFLSVFVVVLDNLLTDQRAVRRLLVAIGVSTIVPLGFGIWQLVEGQGRLIDGISRIEGSFAHPNTYGFYLAVIGLALIGVIRSLPIAQKLIARALLLVVVASLVVTYSRTSYAAFAAGVIVMAILGRRWMLLGITLVTIAVAPLIPAVGGRLADLGEGATLRGTPGNSLTWRLDYWQTVVEVGEGRRATGVGLGVVSELTDSGREPHNDFVRAFVELGVIGLAAYVVFLLVMGWQARTALRRTQPETGRPGLPRCLAEGFAGICAAYLVESVTGNPMTQLILLSYVIALALAASHSASDWAVPPRRPDGIDVGRRPEPIYG